VARDFQKDIELVEVQMQYSVPGTQLSGTGGSDIDIVAAMRREVQSGKPQAGPGVNEKSYSRLESKGKMMPKHGGSDAPNNGCNSGNKFGVGGPNRAAGTSGNAVASC
jgi:hypothetical protein